MRSGSELKGMAVVDVGGGKKLGQVAEVVVSPDDLRLLGLVVKSGGLLSQEERVVEADDIRSIGRDAITVDGEDAAHARDTAGDELKRTRSGDRRLVGAKVVTKSGSLVGTVSDFLIDEGTRRVTGLTLGAGPFSTSEAVRAERIASVGPDVIVVHDETTGGTTPG